jgi:phospholipase/carboxylesterase
MRLNHYTVNPKSGESPKHIVILLHGYGSNGHDLISLAPYWQEDLPDTVFVSPDAPFPCEIAPESGFQWFPLMERTERAYLAGVEMAAPILDEYLDDVLDHYNLSNKNMALVGFSQGTMMGLYVGPRRKPKIAGILGYSGALIGENGLSTENKVPIQLIHGEDDSVVPVEAYHKAVEFFSSQGFEVGGHTTPGLDHSIDMEGIRSGAKFLGQVLI